MSYRLIYARRAEKDIKKFDPSLRRQIARAIVKLESDPIGSAEKLIEPAIGTYRFRIGDYRVIFDIEGKDVVILRIGHRKDIYRKHS